MQRWLRAQSRRNLEATVSTLDLGGGGKPLEGFE